MNRSIIIPEGMTQVPKLNFLRALHADGRDIIPTFRDEYWRTKDESKELWGWSSKDIWGNVCYAILSEKLESLKPNMKFKDIAA